MQVLSTGLPVDHGYRLASYDIIIIIPNEFHSNIIFDRLQGCG